MWSLYCCKPAAHSDIVSASHLCTVLHICTNSFSVFRDSSLQLGDRQSSVTGGFGDLSQRSSFPDNRGTSISSKVLPSQESESFRRPRVQYDDDFLNKPVNATMGG